MNSKTKNLIALLITVITVIAVWWIWNSIAGGSGWERIWKDVFDVAQSEDSWKKIWKDVYDMR